jgi:hypothetical protein
MLPIEMQVSQNNPLLSCLFRAADLGFFPGSTDEPFILLSKQENYGSLRGKGLGLRLTFYQSC